MDVIQSILDGKDPTIHSIGPDGSVLDAVGAMCRFHVGALLVNKGEACVGIISERDIMTRVLLRRLDLASTPVSVVMTREVVRIAPEIEPEEAMALMTKQHCRHLPVAQTDGRVIGIISMGDLVQWATCAQETENRSLREYVSGVHPG